MRLAIIPARGGSVRLPGKNIRDFRGRPVIWYSISAARESTLFDEVVVSTDCLRIAEVAMQFGATVFERQTDDGQRGTQDVAAEVLASRSEVTEACVIYATCPLLESQDLVDGHRALVTRSALFSMSVQAQPLADAGCFYWGRAAAFRAGLPLIAPHTAMVPLPAERVCDINTAEDWARAESMFDALRKT